MNPSRPFILRPVATSLLMAALLITGLIAYRLLPVSALPQVDFPTIQIFTFYPGASPAVTASAITAPLERRFGQIPGVDQMSSTSSAGASVITLQFALEVSLGVAEQEVQAAINASSNLLPNDLPAPPIYRKVNPADTPILTLAVTSASLPLPQVHDLVDTRIAQKLAQISRRRHASSPPVASDRPCGTGQPAARPARPKRGGGTCRDRLRELEDQPPKGGFDGPIRTILMDANDQLRSVEEFRNLIIAWRDGAPCGWGMRRASRTRPKTAASPRGPTNRPPCWSMRNASRARMSSRSSTACRRCCRNWPPICRPPWKWPCSPTAPRASAPPCAPCSTNSCSPCCSWCWSRSFSCAMSAATIIPSIAVPLSLVGTFGVMYLSGFSLNILTLMAADDRDRLRGR
jgi:multidrug efflux pump